MTVETFPLFCQEEVYSAEALRHAFGTLLARGSAIGSIVGGLVGSGDMLVTAGSGLQALVAPGEAWITGTSASTQGAYLGRVTSSTALSISAASESNPRIDTVIAQVKDKFVVGSEDAFTVTTLTGTAESGSTLANRKGAASVPASSLVLAYVLIPAKAVKVEAGNIENVAARLTTGLSNPVEVGSIEGPVSRSQKTRYTPNATRPVWVTLFFNLLPETTGVNAEAYFEATLNGKVIFQDTRGKIPEELSPVNVNATTSFICAPGDYWEASMNLYGPKAKEATLESVYRTL